MGDIIQNKLNFVFLNILSLSNISIRAVENYYLIDTLILNIFILFKNCRVELEDWVVFEYTFYEEYLKQFLCLNILK